MPDHNKQHRPRLDRAKVLAEAISLADAEGLDALSMRALATRMGVVPMALYKHVADKDDLIGGMVDAVVASYPDPPAAGSWRERVRSRILAAHATATVHPWLSRAIETRTRRTETIFGHMNAVAGDFIDGGFSPTSPITPCTHSVPESGGLVARLSTTPTRPHSATPINPRWSRI